MANNKFKRWLQSLIGILPKTPFQAIKFFFKTIFIVLILWVFFDFPLYYRGEMWNPEVILLIKNIKAMLELYRLLVAIRGGLTLYMINPYGNIFLTTLWNITDPILKIGLFIVPKVFGIQFNSTINMLVLSYIIKALDGLTTPPKPLDSLYERKRDWWDNWDTTLRSLMFDKDDMDKLMQKYQKLRSIDFFSKPNFVNKSPMPQWPENDIPWKSINFSHEDWMNLSLTENIESIIRNTNIENVIDINALHSIIDNLHHIQI